MSLSRRYLSLPLELAGTSLPPQVSGDHYGYVTLCITHILPSAVSSIALPLLSLVRVRWWGEETPGSLFRPRLLSGQTLECEESPHRVIAMKYPVCVPSPQLLEYLEDMIELRMEVTDRTTRKKVGECSLALDLYRKNAVMTAEEKLVALRRDNELCEIISCQNGQEKEVLGYLAVSFHVQWDQLIETEKDFDTVMKDIEEVASGMPEIKKRDETVEQVELSVGDLENNSIRIRRLLRKGKKLQRSMERAVKDEEMEASVLGEGVTEFRSTGALVPLPHADVTMDKDTRLESWEAEVMRSSLSSAETNRQENGGTHHFEPEFVKVVQSEIHSGCVPKSTAENSYCKRCDCELLQLGVMLEEVSSIVKMGSTFPARLSSNTLGGRGKDEMLVDGASISLQYTVPSRFTRISAVSNNFERTITRKLRASRWLDNAPRLWADYSGHINVFQPSFAVDAKEYLSSGYLIFESWLHTAKDAERRLLGLSKVPLRKLAQVFSTCDADLPTYLERTLPVVTVDNRFPIENPFTGHLSGYLRTRICLGTAEQVLTWAKTIRAIIELQAVIRGVLCREQSRRSRLATLRAALTPETSELHSRALVHEDSRSDSQSTAPTLTTTLRAQRVIGINDSCARDDTSEKQSEYVSDDLEINDTAPGNHYNRQAVRKIRFDVRESWRSAMQGKHPTGEHQKQRGWGGAPLLGCELQGQLVLVSDTGLLGKVKGLPFALWWDAADNNLNSSFRHVFRSRGVQQMKDGVDGAFVGPQSQVLFALHVENGFFGTQSRETIMGEARLNLYETFGKRVAKSKRIDGASRNIGVDDSWIDVDIPIEWDGGDIDHRMLPSAIPVRISYHIELQNLGSELGEADTAGDISNKSSVDSPIFGSTRTSYALGSKSRVSDDGAASSDEDSDNEYLEINADYYNSITLATFGIEELELSPRADDDMSLEENEQMTTSEPAVTLPRPCDVPLRPMTEEDAVLDGLFSYSLVLTNGVEEGQVRGKSVRRSPGSEFDNEESDEMEGFLDRPGENFDQCSGQEQTETNDDAGFSDVDKRTKDVDSGLEELDSGIYVKDSSHTVNTCVEMGNTVNNVVADTASDNVPSRNMDLENKSSVDSPIARSTNYSRTCYALQPKSGLSDDGDASSGEDSDSDNLEINAEYVEPITLTTFGIEKLELPPLADDETSRDENEQMTTSEPAAILPRPCNESLRSMTEKDAGSDDQLEGSGEQFEQCTGQEQTEMNDDAGFSAIDTRTKDVDSGLEELDFGVDVEDSAHTVNINVEMDNTVNNIVAENGSDNVPCCNMDAENPSCANDFTPSEPVSIPDIETEQEVQLETEEVQYADKAIQVDPFELGIQVEMVACSVQTSPSMSPKQESDEIVSEDSDDEAKLGDLAAGSKSTVDVSCDAMGVVDTPSESHHQSEEPFLITNKERLVGKTVTMESGVPSTQLVLNPVSNSNASTVNLPTRNDQSASSVQNETHGFVGNLNNPESVHSRLQNEKLELVYEMLRDMRDSYFAKAVVKSASGGANDLEYSDEQHSLVTVHTNPLVYANKATTDKRCSCPSSPISRTPSVHTTRKVSLDESVQVSRLAPNSVNRETTDKRCSCPSSPISGAPSVHGARKVSLDESVANVSSLEPSSVMARASSGKRCSCPSSPIARYPAASQARDIQNAASTSGFKPAAAFEQSPKKLSSLAQLVERRMKNKAPAIDGRALDALRTSLPGAKEKTSYRESIDSIDRLSSSDVCVSQKHYSFRKSQVVEKNQHSSVHSLFSHDSETERIARIMQGSMNYWMKEDSSSSCDDEVGEEEETDDDCYF